MNTDRTRIKAKNVYYSLYLSVFRPCSSVAKKHLSLLHLRVPVIEQGADVLVTEIAVGQVAGQVHGAAQLAGIGVTFGKLIKNFLVQAFVGRAQVRQRFLEVALRQPPVVAVLEAKAEINQRLAMMARIVADGLQFADRF